ncbi:Myb-like_DNA-binding domain-containing protein [Hexamita inflata]|uniref:Myb-like_DNA-binding domain-containing protein n=1 Tax=Hexamita inflata TaxID=28002 RepID=A0ABP1HC31_9EUKA
MNRQNKYHRWTDDENAKLQFIISQNKQNNIIKWSEVVKHFPEYSLQQLKSQYSNRQQSKPSTYHIWSEHEIQILLLCVLNYGKNWQLIHEQYFPQISQRTIQSKWQVFNKELQEILNIMQQLQIGDLQSVQKYSNEMIRLARNHINLLNNRMKVMQGIPLNQPTNHDIQMGLDKLDNLEIKPLLDMMKYFNLEQLDEKMQIVEKMLLQ